MKPTIAATQAECLEVGVDTDYTTDRPAVVFGIEDLEVCLSPQAARKLAKLVEQLADEAEEEGRQAPRP